MTPGTINKQDYKQLCKRLLDAQLWSRSENIKRAILDDLRNVDQIAFMGQILKDVQGVLPTTKENALAVIGAIAEIGALWLLEDGGAEELLINIFMGFQRYYRKEYLNYRMNTVSPLVSIGTAMEDSKAIPELIEGLMDNEEEFLLRGKVAAHLPLILDDPRVQDAIVFALGDSAHLRTSIMEALFQRAIHDHDNGKEYHPLCQKGVESMIDVMLNSKSEIVRSSIAKEIGAIYWDPKVVDGLILALQDGRRPVNPDEVSLFPKEYPSAGEWAIEWLAKIGVQRGIDAIIPLKVAGDDNVPADLSKPYELIERIGEPAFEPLVRALNHENFKVRDKASIFLTRLYGKRALEPLIAVLEDKGSGATPGVTSGLIIIGDPCAIAPLIKALHNANMLDRSLLKSALENIIIKGENFDQAVDLLIDALQSEDKNVRIFAAQTLGKMKDKNVVEHLKLLLEDKDRKVRTSAERALKEIQKG